MRPRIQPASLLGLALVLTACSTVTTHTPDGRKETRTVEEFRQYAEEVFRRQNEAASAVIFWLDELEDDSPDTYTALEASEARMLQACQALNQVAARRRDQQRVGLGRKRAVVRTIGACEVATQALELELRRVQE